MWQQFIGLYYIDFIGFGIARKTLFPINEVTGVLRFSFISVSSAAEITIAQCTMAIYDCYLCGSIV